MPEEVGQGTVRQPIESSRESEIERHFVWTVETMGGKTYKFTSPGVRGVADRVAVAQGDLFAGLVGLDLEGTADLIVCNPPYISQGRLAGDRAPLLEHEPREAFDGGPYGLSIHQRVIREALPYLREGGTLMFEIGLGQDRQLKLLFDRARGYSSLLAVPNAAGEVRVVAGRKESKMASASITGI
jgi:release factor glutamine methyltransferase